MKNRKLLFILVPAVLFIWGAIAYSILEQMKGPDDESQNEFTPAVKATSDTLTGAYKLLANYRDPFLSGRSAESDGEDDFDRNKLNRHVTVNPVIPQMAIWPAIQYSGLISSNSNWLALLNVNGANYLMKAGETQNNLKLVVAYKDSVLLEYQKELKTILKK